ncbi:ribbon-helix-helix domain-containing protein [Salinarimonas sp.]|uniref:ribbon-helix-helix domain-containing protein n=1 Tax=Salinarimonas sp. TaxID=2766526 RepID=UPI00391BA16B
MRDDTDEGPPRPDGAAQATAPDVPVPTVEGGAQVIKRSVAIAGHRTSISLEAPFWEALWTLAARRGQSLQRLVAEIDAARGPSNLSSAIRVRLLAEARAGALPRSGEATAQDASGPLDLSDGEATVDGRDPSDAQA